MSRFTVFALDRIPEIKESDDLGDIILTALGDNPLKDGDIIAVAHKIVSKAEGRMVSLEGVSPSEAAYEYARRSNKDPRVIELVLQESENVLYCGAGGPIIVRHKLGLVCANAGVDVSNSEQEYAVLLPVDPDASAKKLRERLETAFAVRIGVLILDTHGRAFREAACGIAIGASGVRLLKSYVGEKDRGGRVMQSSVEAQGDELAAAATLVMGQGMEGRPVAVIRGFEEAIGEDVAANLVRPVSRDVFVQALQKNKNT